MRVDVAFTPGGAVQAPVGVVVDVLGLEADIEWCGRESLVRTLPRYSRMVGPAAEIVPSLGALRCFPQLFPMGKNGFSVQELDSERMFV